MTVSTAHSETEIKESVREFQSLIVSGEETGLVNISPSKCSLKCQKVMISGIPDWVLNIYGQQNTKTSLHSLIRTFSVCI